MFNDTNNSYTDNTDNVETLTHLRTIKGTAMNKGRARVWLELAEEYLAPYGFARGCPVTIELGADAITITSDPAGKRKMAGRTRNGRTICILDICFPAEQRAAMFDGAAELDVFAGNGVIVIRRADA